MGSSAEEDDASPEQYDELGFSLSTGMDRNLDPEIRQKSTEYASWFEPKAQRRLKRFEAQRQKLARPGQWLECKQKDLKQLLRKGLPPEWRAEVWWSILGCEARRRRSPRAYAQYLSERLDTKPSDEIDRDLPRTFPNHVRFRSDEGKAELRNVLHAFARYVPEVRYCQGLNFIVAVLLIVLKEEERAFWALVCAVDRLGVLGYYAEGMTLLRADMHVLASLLQEHCPQVSKQLTTHRVDLLSVCSEWYITWFARCLPIQTLLRVWDALFFEGFKIIFRVSIGIFRQSEPGILRCECFEDLMETAKLWPREQIQHNELLKASFGGSRMRPVRRRDLGRARSDALQKIRSQDQEQKCRSEARLQAKAA